jgi:HEAT repeat protein/MFS family permease
MSQVYIWLSLFIENLFSPLESERVFPVIESSEPIGGILSGLLIITLVEKVSVLNMLTISGAILLAIPILMYFAVQKLESISVLRTLREERNTKNSQKNLFVSGLRFFRNHRFVGGLFVVVFFSYFAYQLLEYNYAAAVYQHTRHSEEYTYGPIDSESKSYADALTHNFGQIQTLIFSLLFLVQVLFASGILRRIGVMQTYALAPLFSFFSFAAMFIHPAFFTTILAKGVFEVSSGLGKNAYLASFYALREEVRGEAKEVIDGIGKPIGLLFGTFALLALEALLPTDKMIQQTTMLLVGISMISFFVVLTLRAEYTSASKKKLFSELDITEKMNAIEILGQRGHLLSEECLIDALRNKKELPEVKKKILQVIGSLEEEKAIPDIIHCFYDKDKEIRLEAVKALGKYKHLGKKFFSQAFSVYSMQSSLKELFLKSKSTSIKVAAIKVFANLKDPEIIPFLIEALKSNDSEIRAEAVSVCGLFHDASTIRHLKPLLKDKIPRVRSATIVALWQFLELRLELMEILSRMLHSKRESEVLAGIFAAGETGSLQEKECLFALLKNKNERIRRHAAISLGKMNEKSAAEHILYFLFHKEKNIGKKTKEMTKSIHKNIRKTVEKRSIQEVIDRVSHILHSAGNPVLENLATKELTELLHLFHLINAEREVWKIRMILSERNHLSFATTSP